jgi:hypothetical protein
LISQSNVRLDIDYTDVKGKALHCIIKSKKEYGLRLTSKTEVPVYRIPLKRNSLYI